jgi:excisionase family DNA binding protein
MEGLSQNTTKELTGKAKDILARMDKVDSMLQKLKAEIEKGFDDPVSTSPLLTKKEVCRFLKISIVTLNKLIANGAIKSFKVGGKTVRIHESELKSYQAN